jgi:predicted Zn-dependent peptidase
MNFKKKTLPNGLRIITAPMKEAQTAAVMVFVETGSDYETKELNGISHFLEHMLFKGTNRRSSSDLNNELDGAGAQSNAFTSNEYTGYYAKAHHRKLPVLIDVVSDIYLNSTLPVVDIEKERGVIIEEINMYQDLPQKKVWSVLSELIYGKQAAGRSVLGPISNIEKITREDFVAYQKEHYVAEATIVVVTGRFDEKKIIATIERNFADISIEEKTTRGGTAENQKAPGIRLEYKKTDQSHLIFGFRTYPVHHKDQPVVSMIATVLAGGMSSRLFREMRDERGLCYYVYAHPDTYIDRGLLAIGSGVGHAKLDEAISVILSECSRLTHQLVEDKELQKAKDYIIGNAAMDLESTDEIGMFLASQELLMKDIKNPQERFKEIRNVTAADIMRVARKIFKPENTNLAVIGPDKEGEERLRKHFNILARRKK